MVRNGDAHLKNFGMLYPHPVAGQRQLAPLYDVVTTSVYPHINLRTGETQYDRTMALKLSAMSDTWRAHQDRLQGDFATAFAAEWDAGRASLSSPKVYVSNVPMAAPAPDGGEEPDRAG